VLDQSLRRKRVGLAGAGRAAGDVAGGDGRLVGQDDGDPGAGGDVVRLSDLQAGTSVIRLRGPGSATSISN
jgi:hypothetical protein